MKCLYTESDITYTAAQIMVCAVSLDGKVGNVQQQKFKRAFPDAYNAMLSMINANVEEKFRAKLGDVIWVQTSGNKHIGFCIVKEKIDDIVHSKALRLCLKSIVKKAKALNHDYIGMDLFACDTPEEWGSIVNIIEKELKDIQAVVCIPTNDALVRVLDSLPGPKTFRKIYGT